METLIHNGGAHNGEAIGEASASGVSWPAVFGGAFGTAALSLILLALGAGLGLSSVSPWSNVGASAATAGRAAIVWLILTELISSAMGGYLAGRLRTKWTTIHTDEVYFRDTANGFLAWAVALIVTAAFLGSSASSMVMGEPQTSPASSSADASRGRLLDPTGYFVDRLFRTDRPSNDQNGAAVVAEAERVMVHELQQPLPSVADTSYLSQLVAARTGLTQGDAAKRVSEVTADARQAIDTARKLTAHLLLWVFLALLIGAFSASYAATIGGRQRDHVKLI